MWRSVRVRDRRGRRQTPLVEVSGGHGHGLKPNLEGFEVESRLSVTLPGAGAEALQFKRKVPRAGSFFRLLGAETQHLSLQVFPG